MCIEAITDRHPSTSLGQEVNFNLLSWYNFYDIIYKSKSALFHNVWAIAYIYSVFIYMNLFIYIQILSKIEFNI